MNPYLGLERLANWLLNHSLQGGVLVLVVLLAQWTFRRRLTGRWRFALWWVVLARLLLPVGPQSIVSVFNYVRPIMSLQSRATVLPTEQPGTLTAPNNVTVEHPPAQPTTTALATDPAPSTRVSLSREIPNVSTDPAPVQTYSSIPTRNQPSHSRLVLSLATVWLGGVLVLSASVAIQILRFQRKLARSATQPDATLHELLKKCREEFGVTRRIEPVETNAVKSPALFGLFRLRLLLPPGFAAQFSTGELRHIFLHELAHVKRGDLWLNWLVTALQLIHWFNPLIWLGFARLRADRELACDELALIRAGDTSGVSYGETIIKLLEGIHRPPAIPGLVGILEDKKQMRRRILMIANFKNPGRWPALAVLLVAALAAATLTDAQTDGSKQTPSSTAAKATTTKNLSTTNHVFILPKLNEEDTAGLTRPDLTGEVRAKNAGPLAATVFIATAGPKTGTSTFCPSCYADCRKNAKADAQGHFQIDSLNPRLVFQVLAVAKGYKPKFVSKVDPAKGPIKIELDAVTAADAPPERSLRGRVLDHEGKPIEGAVVEMDGVRTRDGRGSWGTIKGVDPLAVTDENGEFLITSQEPYDMMDVTVKARQCAPKNFTKLPCGTAHNELTVTEGTTVVGRVLFDGKPLKDVSIGISGVERGVEEYVGHYEVGTAANGVFALMNLPPDADYYIYGIMDSMKQFGAIPLQKIHVGKDGEETQVGDLIVKPAHRLAGHLELADGQPVPPKTRLLVSREEAWDSVQLTLDEHGGFDITGIPSETISLSARVKGYRVSPKNGSLDLMNPFQLIGRVNSDITNLVVLLDKGAESRPDYDSNLPDSEWPRNRPLRGAEGGVDHSREWQVSGQVLDEQTKQPIPAFRVTPGDTDQFDRTSWNEIQALDATNGIYRTYVNKRFNQPLLKIEADGYLPAKLVLKNRDTTNADVSLKKGNGPAGTVVLTDGTPAVGATVVLLSEGRDQAGLDSRNKLSVFRNTTLSLTLGSNGQFAFKPKLGMQAVAAASSNGFACADLATLATNPVITLRPYASIHGILRRNSSPGTNEDLDLAFTSKNPPGLSQLQLQHHAVTDTQGRFEFRGVPPGALQITYRDWMSNHSWQSTPLKEVELLPGQSLELNIETGDRPAKRDEIVQPPAPKRIPGAEITGVVLKPDGTPAADAEVGLQVENKYLAVGRGTFASSFSARQDGLIVNADSQGHFTLPLYEKAISVVALNEEGFARVSLDELKTSPQLRLQKWGRIEGSLKMSRHPATNETVVVQPVFQPSSVRRINGTNDTVLKQSVAVPLIYDFESFKSRTDDHGQFEIALVPPGEVSLARLVDIGHGTREHRRLGNVDVKAGQTEKVQYGEDGKTVIGKIVFDGTNTIDLQNSRASLHSPAASLLMKLKTAQSAEERNALMQSEEFKKAIENARDYSASVAQDGTFRVEDVPPGKYELGVHEMSPGFRMARPPAEFRIFNSTHEIVVPAGTNEWTVDAGTVEMKPLAIPTNIIQQASGK